MPPLRIITWNCNWALHQKFERLLSLQPDIAVVPECASPDVLRRKAPGFLFSACEWQGTDPNRGLGVFAFGDLQLRRHESWDPRFHLFLPIEVRGAATLNLLAVWAFNHRTPARVSPNPVTTAQAIEHYQPFLQATPSVVAGDFNASVIWDRKDRPHNFSNVDRTLNGLGLASAYHEHLSQDKGTERHPTLYFRRDVGKPYHIDYIYLPDTWIGGIRELTIGSPDEWLRDSDHVPLVVECEASHPRTATT
jgi:exodeoxyribonuclease III